MSVKSIAVVMTVAAAFAGLMAFGSDRFIAMKPATHPSGELEAETVSAKTVPKIQQRENTKAPGELSRAQIEHDVVHSHGVP
ncbi:MAG: hypothetical protein EOO38_07760 [Cytophagaceae bacterium]|jgi:hypothetical protein|nr:MAG: hypothetical protein EOO38_07760 [Cytophagaceae bacterium]